MLTIEPFFAFFMSGTTAWMAKNWCLRFTRMRSSKYSGVTLSSVWRSSWAALLTRMVIGPSALRTSLDRLAQRVDVGQVAVLEMDRLALPARGGRRAPSTPCP